LNTKFIEDINSEKTYSELTKEIKKGADLDIDSTPTIFINGDKYVGVMPYKELKDKLVEHGAKQ